LNYVTSVCGDLRYDCDMAAFGYGMPPGFSRFLGNRLGDLAWGCGVSALLVPPVAYSLALDEISVSSHLGQPLEAVIPVNGAAGELLDSACFSVAAAADAGLPGIEGVHLRLDPVTGQLTLRSAEPVLEPLSEVTIRVRCDGAPGLDRTFLVVLDPPDARAEAAFARTRDATTQSQPATNRSAFEPAADVSATPAREVGTPHGVARARASGLPARQPSRPARIEPTVAIAPGSEYHIQVGDTLSSIAARVRGRPAGSLWAIAERIHAQNPMAFIGGDPDRLIAGTEIEIPTLDGDLAASYAQIARTGAFAHPHAMVAPRTHGGARSLRRFALSTSLSPESIEKLQLRQSDYAQAVRAAANARLASIVGTPVATKPEEPDAGRDERDDVELSTDDDVPAALEAEDTTASGENDGVERYVQATPEPARESTLPEVAPEIAPVTQAAKVVAAQGVAPETEAPDADVNGTAAAAPRTGVHGSPLQWTLSVLGMVVGGGALGALLTRLFARHRRAAALERARNQRRASGLERTIRLDHGIEVREHPVGTPLTVEASTQEIAAIRLVQPKRTPSVPMSEHTQPIPEMRSAVLGFATEAPTDLSLRIESPVAALDLELPAIPESPTVPENDVPTEVMAPVAPRDQLADSRQFLVDTDLLALAYREDGSSADASAEPLPLDVMAELPMPPTAAPAAAQTADDHGYFHLDTEPVGDAEHGGESTADSSLLELWEINEDEDAPNVVAVARVSRKR
jgi:hypothetical protein